MKPLTRRIVVFFSLLLLFVGLISNPTLAEVSSTNDAINSTSNAQREDIESTTFAMLEQEAILSLASYSAIPEANFVTSESEADFMTNLPHVSLNGLLTSIYLTNLSDIDAAFEIMFFNPDGSVALSYYDGSIISPHALCGFHLDELGLPTGYEGSAIISSSAPIASVAIIKTAGGNGLLSYSAFSFGATSIYFPRVMRNWYGWDSDLWIQNIGGAEAEVTLHFMSATGEEIHSQSNFIPAGAPHVYHTSEIFELGTSLNGWVWVESDQPITGVVEEWDSTSDRAAAYNSFLDTSQTLLSTWQLKDVNGLSSVIRILNPWESSESLLTEFINFDGSSTHSQADDLASGNTLDLNLVTISQLPIGFDGSAYSESMFSRVMGISSISGSATGGIDNYAVNPMISMDYSVGITFPLVMHNVEEGLSTQLSVNNYGGTAADVTVSFVDQDGALTTSFSDSIPANGTTRYSTNDVSALGTDWQGSASVQASLGQEIYGEALQIVSQSGYSISGSVTDSNDQPLSEVLISTNTGTSAVSNDTGFYVISGLLTGTYTLTPSKAGYTFSPPSQTISVPPDATGIDFLGTPTTPKLKLLIVPLDWQNTQQAFDLEAQTQTDIFLDEVPLNACRERVIVDTLSVTSEDFEDFTCSIYNCGLSSIRTFVQDELNIDPAEYDVIVGLAETSSCPPIAGCSNGTDTIWVTSQYDIVTAHELGHIYNLEDEYCSNQAGSTDRRCNDGDIQDDGAVTGDVNWLDADLPCDCPADGSNDSGYSPCCNFGSYDCSNVNYGICCLGNKNPAGGRSTMSYANAAEPRGFDIHDLAHLSSLPQLTCDAEVNSLQNAAAAMSTDGSQKILNIDLLLHSDGSVSTNDISIQYGLPTSASILEGMLGDYELRIIDVVDNVVWSQEFDVFFDYQGPVVLDVDYSSISFDAVDVSFRIPQACGMNVLELYHNGELIFSEDLPLGCISLLPLVVNAP
jgi:hypothetical protein